MNSIKSKDRKSLCEESMLVFVNILKLSSVSFTRRNLATKSDHHNHDHQYSDDGPPLVPVPATQRSKMSRKSKRSYVMLPEDEETRAIVDGKFSDYIKSFHEKTANDLENAEATNFIKKFHDKNLKDFNNESMRRPNYVLPPPPHHQLFH
ncbi:unnamed protein product [Amaranthus hypochondriacus]